MQLPQPTGPPHSHLSLCAWEAGSWGPGCPHFLGHWPFCRGWGRGHSVPSWAGPVTPSLGTRRTGLVQSPSLESLTSLKTAFSVCFQTRLPSGGCAGTPGQRHLRQQGLPLHASARACPSLLLFPGGSPTLCPLSGRWASSSFSGHSPSSEPATRRGHPRPQGLLTKEAPGAARARPGRRRGSQHQWSPWAARRGRVVPSSEVLVSLSRGPPGTGGLLSTQWDRTLLSPLSLGLKGQALAEGHRARPQLFAPLGHNHGRPEGLAPRSLTDPLAPAPWALKPLSRVQRPLLKPSTPRPCPPVPAVLGPGPVGRPAW